LRKLPLDPRKSGLYRFGVEIGSHSTALAPQMPLPALQLLERKLEKQKRLFELRRGALERRIEQQIQLFEQRKGELERKIEQQFENHKRKFEQKFDTQKKKIETRIRHFEQKNGIRLDDEVRFIRSWIEKPLTTGAVTPSGRVLARTMAAYIDPNRSGAIIELGPGTGPVTEALLAQGIDPSRLVLIEFDPTFCRLLRARYPAATVVQGDAYALKRLLSGVLQRPAAGVVSGLPLFTKPLRMRLRLLFEAFALMSPGAPFVQFTYNAVAPIPKRLDRVSVEASERVWMNIPPARVWVYRRD
jgi:phosphatidylethanolamine/phosphatidyl-N-methylethanolamine N-methyltransferase